MGYAYGDRASGAGEVDLWHKHTLHSSGFTDVSLGGPSGIETPSGSRFGLLWKDAGYLQSAHSILIAPWFFCTLVESRPSPGKP